MRNTIAFAAVLAFAFGATGLAQSNVALNSSFEYPAFGDPAHAADWQVHGWWPAGYSRIAVPDAWDNGYVLELRNPAGTTPRRAGAVQTRVFNPPTTDPLRIRAFVRVNGIPLTAQNGANIYCEITFSDGTRWYGPPWQMYWHKGTTPYWREMGFNTAHLGLNKPIQSVTVVPMLDATGAAQFDSVEIERFLPLARGAVTFMGDDGPISQYQKMFPILKSFGYPLSIAAVLNYIGKTGYMNDAQLREIQAAGGSIESHTVSHRDLAAAPAETMKSEIWWAMDQLRKRGYGARHLILPYGSYSPAVLEYAQWFHDSVRNTWRATNPAGTFRLDVRTHELQNTTAFDQAKSWIDEAARNRTWVIIMAHQVMDACPTGSAGTYCTTTSLLSLIAQYVASQPVDVVNYDTGFRLTQSN